MLKAEFDTDVESTESPCELHKSGDVAFIHTAVGIRNFGDVCCKEIRGPCISVFLSKPNLSLPERMTDN